MALSPIKPGVASRRPHDPHMAVSRLVVVIEVPALICVAVCLSHNGRIGTSAQGRRMTVPCDITNHAVGRVVLRYMARTFAVEDSGPAINW